MSEYDEGVEWGRLRGNAGDAKRIAALEAEVTRLNGLDVTQAATIRSLEAENAELLSRARLTERQLAEKTDPVTLAELYRERYENERLTAERDAVNAMLDERVEMLNISSQQIARLTAELASSEHQRCAAGDSAVTWQREAARLREALSVIGRLERCPLCNLLRPHHDDPCPLKEPRYAPAANQPAPEAPRPRIVCLCGSTRFWEKFRDEGLRLKLEGKIVLSIGICAPDSMVLAHPESAEGKRQKAMLDQLHKRKIDVADEILVLNVGGYIGDSTRSEIDYAERHGKIIRWLEPVGTKPAPDARDVAIAGRLERTISDFERAAKVCLANEQERANPDNALIAILCDAVRLAREYGEHPPLIPIPEARDEGELKANSPCLCKQPLADHICPERVATLVAALEFYADRDEWTELLVTHDKGDRARAALAQLRERA